MVTHNPGCPQTSLKRNPKLLVALGCWPQLPRSCLRMLQLPWSMKPASHLTESAENKTPPLPHWHKQPSH